MKIVFTGAQGVGKTTLLDILEKCFTLPQQFTFVRNFTRNLAKSGYIINEGGTDDTQLAIMNLHKHYMDCEDNIIMDRCALDGIVYTSYLHRKNQITDSTWEKCKELFQYCINKCDLIYYLVPEFPITGDEYRSDKSEYQAEIAAIFEELIQEYDLKVIKLTGTVGDRLLKIQQTFGGTLSC